MAVRPAGKDRDDWRRERDQVWKRRNRVITILMVVAILLILARYGGVG